MIGIQFRFSASVGVYGGWCKVFIDFVFLVITLLLLL